MVYFYFLCSIIHNVFVVTTITNIRLLEKLIVMHRAVGTNNKCVVGRDVDKIKHIFIVLVLPTKSVLKH
jgi:hypothetical protein